MHTKRKHHPSEPGRRFEPPHKNVGWDFKYNVGWEKCEKGHVELCAAHIEVDQEALDSRIANVYAIDKSKKIETKKDRNQSDVALSKDISCYPGINRGGVGQHGTMNLLLVRRAAFLEGFFARHVARQNHKAKDQFRFKSSSNT